MQVILLLIIYKKKYSLPVYHHGLVLEKKKKSNKSCNQAKKEINMIEDKCQEHTKPLKLQQVCTINQRYKQNGTNFRNDPRVIITGALQMSRKQI